MNPFGIMHKQWPATALDDTVFIDAPLTFSTEYVFKARPEEVWDVLDGDTAWEWLPFPGVGVKYDSPERGVGVVREMGSVHGLARALWVERERFWRYDQHKRITFGVDSGNWMQRLLVRQYAEDMTFKELPGGRTKVVWTVALNLRAPLGGLKYFKPVWRIAYRIGLQPGVTRRLAASSTGSSSVAATTTAVPSRR